MKIEWNEERFGCGIEVIDQQHQALFTTFGELDAAIRLGQSKEEVGRALEFLETYATDHFSTEEEQMEKLKCRTKAANERAHEEFIRRLKDFRSELEQNGPSVMLATSLHSDLVEWFIAHIERCDCALREVAGSCPNN